jgi:hypothetical protein
MNIEIDKSEIALMIEQTKKNMEIVKDVTKPYHDADACKYINDVLKNYTDVYHYIKETIKNNIEVFFNLDKLCISNGSSIAAIHFPDVPIKNNVNEMFTIQFRLKLGPQKYWEDDTTLYASVNADSIYDIDPYIDTSDTKKWEYKYSWGYDHNARKLMTGDIVIKSGCKFTAKDWNIWCEKAEWIKKYTEIFVHEFKSALQSKLEQSKNTVSIVIADSVRRDSENKIVSENVKI